MEKKSKLLLVSSVLALFAAGGVAVGATAGLFTQSGTTQFHIQAGSLNVGFYLSSLKYDQLDPETGMIQTEVEVNLKETYSSAWDDEVQAVDLAKLSGTVIQVSNFYPTMKGIATFKVINGSDIAINSKLNYSLTGTFAPEEPGGERIPMIVPDETSQLDTKFSWLDPVTSEVIEDEVVTILKGKDQSSVLTFEFLNTDDDGSNDNKYQGCDFTIDTLLTATQVIRD